MPDGRIFHIQRFSLHDGPGVRSTVFLKGCPLDCSWCHNPESQSPDQEFIRLPNRCMRCGRCSDEELSEPVVVGRTEQDVHECPTGALQSVGEVRDSSSVVDELTRDRMFFEESGGGVTFSGGEPMMQHTFVTDMLRRLKAESIHTALDTCGFTRWDILKEAAGQADLILYDVKIIDDDRHQAYTGISNDLILENLRLLASFHEHIWIRIPVIPGVNDSTEELEATAAFVSDLETIERVDLLPFHSLGEQKFARAGKAFEHRDLQPPDASRLEHVAGFFREKGLHTTIRGTT